MENHSSKSGTSRSFRKNTISDYASHTGNADIESAIKNIRTKIEVLHLDPKKRSKVISKSAKRRSRKKLQMIKNRSSTTTLDLQKQNCDINVHNIKPKKDIDTATAETKHSIYKLKSNVGHHSIDVEPGNTNVLENRTSSGEKPAESGPENSSCVSINSHEMQRIVDAGISVLQHKRPAHVEHSLTAKGLTEHMHGGTQNGETTEKNYSNINKGLQNLNNSYVKCIEILDSLIIERALKKETKSSHFNGTKKHKKVFKQKFKPIKCAHKAKRNKKYRLAESICEASAKKSTLTTKVTFETDATKIDLSKKNLHPADLSDILKTNLSRNNKRCTHLSVYMFKIHFGANNLSNADIAYLLKLQNSIKIKRVVCRIPMGETTSVMVVRMGSNSEEILKRNKFKASLIRTTVTFEALYSKRFAEEKQDDVTKTDTNSHEANDKPFSWLGKWQIFNTCLNKRSSTVEASSSSTQDKLITQSQNPSEEFNRNRFFSIRENQKIGEERARASDLT